MNRLHLSKETLTVLSGPQAEAAEGGYSLPPSVPCIKRVTQDPFLCFLVPITPIPVVNPIPR
jgi:hypothetical protein